MNQLKAFLKKLRDNYALHAEQVQAKKQEESDLAFMADQNLNTVRGPNRKSHLILWFVITFLVIMFIWAKLAVVDEVTHAEGKVIPSQKIQVIENLEGGIVQAILVREGQIVDKNQILMHIDDTRFASEHKESQLQAATLQAQIARLTSEVEETAIIIPESLKTNFPKIVDNELKLHAQRHDEVKTKLNTLQEIVVQKQQEVAELKSRKEKFSRSLTLVRKELNLTKPLVNEGAVSRVEVLRLERQANDLAGDLKEAELNIPKAQAALNEAQSRIDEFKMEMRTTDLDELNKAKSELAKLKEALNTLQDRVTRTSVRSPVRGIVKKLHINTVGGVIDPGMDILEIVPLDDTLLIEAKIKPKDIGFVKPGDKAKVKFTAYDFAIYGGLDGIVEHISADAIKEQEDEESYYQIRVRTDKNSLGSETEPLVIIPGMQATVDILTGQKTILDYILKPILRGKERALTER